MGNFLGGGNAGKCRILRRRKACTTLGEEVVGQCRGGNCRKREKNCREIKCREKNAGGKMQGKNRMLRRRN